MPYTIISEAKGISKKYGAYLFYAALFLLLFSSLTFDVYEITPLIPLAVKWARRVAALLCIARLSLLSLERPYYSMTSMLIFLLLFISSRSTQYYELAFGALLIASSIDTDFKVSGKIFLGYFIITLTLNPVLYFCGLTNDTIKRGVLTVHSWGFHNPNVFAYYCMMLAFLLCCYKENRRPIHVFAICWTMAIVVGLMTLSKTCVALLLLFPFIFILFKRVKPSATLVASLPLLAILSSILLAAVFGPGYGKSTFESRFSIPCLSYDNYGISWLGHEYGAMPSPEERLNGIEAIFLDNVFLGLPLRDGVIPAVIFFAFLSLLLYRIARSDKPALLAAAVCIIISGFMEQYASYFALNFTLVCCFLSGTVKEGRGSKPVCFAALSLTCIVCLFLYTPWRPLNDKATDGRASIEDIPTPSAYERVKDVDGYASFMRNLPLASEDEPLKCYEDPATAEKNSRYCYRVIDLPIISNFEQCADVCIHLRAEYLFRNHRISDIHFEDTQHNVMKYPWIAGYAEGAYTHYLHHVYEWANTESLKNEMSQRSDPNEVEVGDIWCYDASSRETARYGHAMAVGDVAIDSTTGEKLILLVQGSTPACNIHILENTLEPEISPWFRMKVVDGFIDFGFAKYKADELFYYGL